MSSCNHDCGNCKEKCESSSLLAPANAASKIKKVIAVVSGKGGVGKSTITSLLAVKVSQLGYKTAILDADITGPSIPAAFGINQKAYGMDGNIIPLVSENGIKIMSLNCLLDDPSQPVVWRGSLISGTVKQFWSDVAWGDIDYMFVDMPPGTGDVPLTVFQSLPIDGIVIVTSPQQLVSMIVSKAVNMAKLMNVPILGMVENMSYYECPDCHRKEFIFGESRLEEVCANQGIKLYERVPIDTMMTKSMDAGKVESYLNGYLTDFVKELVK
ncbi:MAG: P-loop NTPase [Christensenellales bacterium]